MASQVFQKPYECLGCKQQIKIAKIDNVLAGQKKKWDKFELDGITPHICKKQQSQEQQTDVSKEIAAIKAQLLVLVGRLDRLEQQELGN